MRILALLAGLAGLAGLRWWQRLGHRHGHRGSPNPLMRSEPSDLGARYLVTYTVPGPADATLEQELYPFAAHGPVTYMRPGQSFWGDQHTHGGWYRGTPQLKAMLVHAGLPSSAHRHRSLLSLALAIVRHLRP